MDDRKLKILSAVVNEYIVTGEPVGSKAIMAHVKASSATIRNEMAETSSWSRTSLQQMKRRCWIQ